MRCRCSMACSTVTYESSSRSRSAPCQKPTSPAGMYEIPGLPPESLGLDVLLWLIDCEDDLHARPPSLEHSDPGADVAHRPCEVDVPVDRLDVGAAALDLRPVVVDPPHLLGRVLEPRCHEHRPQADLALLLGDAGGAIGRPHRRVGCRRDASVPPAVVEPRRSSSSRPCRRGYGEQFAGPSP